MNEAEASVSIEHLLRLLPNFFKVERRVFDVESFTKYVGVKVRTDIYQREPDVFRCLCIVI